MNLDNYSKILVPGWAIPTEVYQHFIETSEILFLKDVKVANFGYFNESTEENVLNLNLEDGVQQLSDYIDTDETVLFCHSLGSIFGLQAASRNKNIKAIVIFSGFGRFAEGEDWDFGQSVRALRAMKMMLRKNPQRLLEDFYSNCAQPVANKIVISNEFNKELLKKGLEMLQIIDIRDILATIQIPVLFIHGTDDVICDCQVAEATFNMITNSKLVKFQKVSDGGHNLLFNNVGEWQKIVVEFFKQIK